jgi:L-fucose isomerase
MGMETALAHILPTRNTFGLEITRLDMKLLADMLAKGAYDKTEQANCATGSWNTWKSGLT